MNNFLSLTGSAGFGLGSTPLPKLSLSGPPPLIYHSCHSSWFHAVLNGINSSSYMNSVNFLHCDARPTVTDITTAPFGQNSLMSLFCFYNLYIYIFSFVKKSVPGSLARERRNLTDMALTKGNFLLRKLSLGQNGNQKFEEKLNKNRSLQALEMRHNSQCIRMDSGLWTVWWTDRV